MPRKPGVVGERATRHCSRMTDQAAGDRDRPSSGFQALAKLLDPAREEDIHIGERLRAEAVAWLTTVRPDGAPRSVPVWFLWEDPLVVVFSGAGTQKLRSLAKNPAVWMTLNAADDGNDVVLLGGVGQLVDPATISAATTPGFVTKYRRLLRDQTIEEWAAMFSQPIRIRVERIVGWTKPQGSCGTGPSPPDSGASVPISRSLVRLSARAAFGNLTQPAGGGG